MRDLTWGALLWLVPAYLAGAIPLSYLVARVVGGVDLRQHGSKNLGATNLYRLLGWKAAVPVGLFDVAKGAAPVLVAAGFAPGPTWWPLAVGLAAVLGHSFSPFVGFTGGKGVATAAGVFVAFAPGALGGAAAVWLLVVLATGYVSLGSVAGAVSFPFFLRLLYPTEKEGFWIAVAACLFIVFTHRGNLRRLLAGTEARFGRRRAPSS
jgi:glycerol-3-phosphate acyltransferase PlsY